MNKQNLFLDLKTVDLNNAGKIDILATDEHIYAISFPGELDVVLKRLGRSYNVKIEKQTNPLIEKTNNQLMEYFDQKRSEFDLPIKLVGTDFQKKVWLRLLQIPFGQTCTYKEIGLDLNIKNGFQAIGQANRNNPICLVVPCHRVVAASGQLSGYIGGTGLKSY